MLYNILATIASINSFLAVILLLTFYYLKLRYGIQGMTERVNRLAGTRAIALVQIYAYLSVVVWIALALPWIDLITIQKLSQFKDGGMDSYLGWMTSRQASIYFVLMFFNILGAKAALPVAELASLLRRGRVRMMKWGIFFVWKPEEAF